MQTIIKKSEYHITVKKTLESVAEAALTGARGNSGIIFAQYFRGLSETTWYRLCNWAGRWSCNAD